MRLPILAAVPFRFVPYHSVRFCFYFSSCTVPYVHMHVTVRKTVARRGMPYSHYLQHKAVVLHSTASECANDCR